MLAAKTQLKHVKSVIASGNRAFSKGTKFAKFDWEDPMNLHGKLTDEEQMIWEVAQNFSKDKLQPRVMKAYNEESFDLEIMKEYGELGFLGCTIPEYGLPGVSSTAYGLINRAVEYVDSGYRSALSVQSSLVMFPIYSYANQALNS
jgi:glutaryl-CoA dehydrogenase